jgi:hypothetical protein
MNHSTDTVKFELLQLQYNTCCRIAKILHEEGVLEEPSVEALSLRTLEIVVKEYNSNPPGLINYFMKRKSDNYR